ncbi:MAG: hypothetical protein KF799_14235 [Bdellovibrionales bacterium]|nr:hypothetical protein [Bdellovibrionales bacterium]
MSNESRLSLVFLARDGVAGRYIAAELAQHFDVKFIWERGGSARCRKLKRYFTHSPLWLWPWRVMDVAAALLISRIVSSAADAPFRHVSLSHEVESITCEDANDSIARSALQRWKPDLVLVYGTAILSKKTLLMAPLFLNLHGGIVPHYQNVHSEFWALRNGETERVGSSVLVVTAGVDNGDIVLQQSIPAREAVSVASAIIANIRLNAELAIRVVRLFQSGQMSRKSQSASLAQSWPTPGLVELWGAFRGRPRLR